MASDNWSTRNYGAWGGYYHTCRNRETLVPRNDYHAWMLLAGSLLSAIIGCSGATGSDSGVDDQRSAGDPVSAASDIGAVAQPASGLEPLWYFAGTVIVCGSTFAGTLIVNRHRVRQDEFDALKAEVKELRTKCDQCEADRQRLLRERDEGKELAHRLMAENLDLLRKKGK